MPSEYRTGQEIKTSVVTLDSISNTIHPPPVSFIKCDIEGHELAMFKGVRKMLAEDKPIILVEIHDDEMAAVNGLLSGHGYSGFFHVGKREHPIDEYDSQHYVKGCHRRNYIFRID